MTRSLRISAELSLPLDWMTLATVVYGARGSGKTTFGSVIAEEVTKAKQRFCAIDLKGDWYGLKSTVDGKDDGIPVVVFGGDHADVPLEEDAGAFLGETVAGLSQSCILDFEHLSKGKQIRFLAPFFETLYHKNRDPLLLLQDEAQRYAPQKPMSPDEARCLGAMQDNVKLGRKHGLGIVVFTQRGAGLNKEVSELCDMLVAFRTPGPLDQDRIKDWLDANATRAQRDEVMGQLSGLATGTAVFASGHPDLRLFGTYPVRMRETFDSSATPKVGQRRKEPKVLAKPELEEIRSKMAAAIERQKADDPKELRKRIVELERELAKKPAAPKVVETKTKVETIEVPALSKEQSMLMKRLENILAKAGENLAGAAGDLRKMAAAVEKNASDAAQHREKLLGKIAKTASPVQSVAPAKTVLVRPSVSLSANVERPAKATTQSNGTANGSGIEPMDRRFLTALAQYPQGRTRKQVLTLASYADSGPVSKSLARLRSNGWMEDERGGLMKITEAGLSALGSFDPLPTGDDLIAHWARKLDVMPGRFFQVLVDRRGSVVPRKELLETAGYADSGPVSKALALLSRLELICVERGHGMTLNDEMFS